MRMVRPSSRNDPVGRGKQDRRNQSRVSSPSTMEAAADNTTDRQPTKTREAVATMDEEASNGEYDLQDDDEEEYPHLFQSIRSPTGLEIGVRVTWPNTEPLELTTCLPADEIAPMFHGTQWCVVDINMQQLWWFRSLSLDLFLTHDTTHPTYSPRTQGRNSCLEGGNCGIAILVE